VATVDVRSHTKWVRRTLQQSELMTEFEIPSATHSPPPPEFYDCVCASLPNVAPVGVLQLLLSLPLKGHIFTGGGVFSFGEIAFQEGGSYIEDSAGGGAEATFHAGCSTRWAGGFAR
jgi:hypothetical protein